jgi:uncharacterized RDD family membrane protein YckC
MSDDETYYDALGVGPDASRDELKSAYQDRVAELEAAREGKNVSEAALQTNREEVARVRAAWNVLADPFQRSRYDDQLTASNGDGEDHDGDDDSDVEVVDDDRPQAQLTGWRKWMAPPPPKPKAKAGSAGNGAPPARRPKEPTLELPRGMRIAEPRARGMATLFDVAVVLIIYWAVLLVVPGVINSDYKAKVDQIGWYNNLHDAQTKINDANTSIKNAQKSIDNPANANAQKTAESDLKSAQSDLKSAQKDFNTNAQKLENAGLPVPHNTDKIQQQADNLSSDIRPAQYLSYLVVLVLALLYLVPLTAITGRTLGMRGRKVRVVKTDGTPVGWYGAFVRFLVPILLALAIPTLGPLLGLGMVLWAFRDANGQGIHDKLAKTVIVQDQL